MKKPILTIIIPAKNEERNIEKCISAILNNDYDKNLFEVIVVDNGSVDKTKMIAEKLGVMVIELEIGTISELRNLGASKSRGEILAFVDADVFVEKNWIKNALKCFAETGAICVGCSPKIPINNTWVERAWHYQIQIRPDQYERDWIASMNMLVKRDAFCAIGGFDPNLYTCEDVDIGYRLRKIGKIVYDKSIGGVHVGEAKNLYSFFKKESWRGISNFVGIAQHGLLLEEMRSNLIASYYFSIYPLMLITILYGHYKMMLMVLVVSLMVPLGITLKIIKTPLSFLVTAQIYLVWATYCFARGYSGYILLKRMMTNRRKCRC